MVVLCFLGATTNNLCYLLSKIWNDLDYGLKKVKYYCIVFRSFSILSRMDKLHSFPIGYSLKQVHKMASVSLLNVQPKPKHNYGKTLMDEFLNFSSLFISTRGVRAFTQQYPKSKEFQFAGNTCLLQGGNCNHPRKTRLNLLLYFFI